MTCSLVAIGFATVWGELMYGARARGVLPESSVGVDVKCMERTQRDKVKLIKCVVNHM